MPAAGSQMLFQSIDIRNFKIKTLLAGASDKGVNMIAHMSVRHHSDTSLGSTDG